MIAAMQGGSSGEREMSRADGGEFSGFVSGEFSFYSTYSDLIMRGGGEANSWKKNLKMQGNSSLRAGDSRIPDKIKLLCPLE